MPRISLVEIAHRLVKAKLRPGDSAIDATVGNGHDTAFLLAQVQPAGHVYGFDIQPEAVAATRIRLGDPTCLNLFAVSHAELDPRVPTQLHGRIRAIMFNLGYLPGGDKRIITRTDSTLPALNAACRLIAPGGIITVVAYPGHPGGDDETAQITAWCAGLNPGMFKAEIIDSQPRNPKAPKLFAIEKLVAQPSFRRHNKTRG